MTFFEEKMKKFFMLNVRRKALEYLQDLPNQQDEFTELVNLIINNHEKEANIVSMYWLYKYTKNKENA